MNLTPLQQRKKQKYLFLILLAIFLATAVVFGRSLVGREEKELPPEFLPAPKIKINFEILENPVLKELRPFQKIEPFEGKPGRENPFAPY